MKLSVLVDNNTLIDRYFLGEPAVSYFLETESVKVLFDVGYSDVFLRNAHKLRIDVCSADYVAISHGHVDHTGGLDVLVKECLEARLERRCQRCPQILAHPQALVPKYLDDGSSIGLTVSEHVLSAHFDVRTSTEPVWLDDKLVFLGQIPRKTAFEHSGPMDYRAGPKPGQKVPDDLVDDTALAYKGKEGVYVITGCSHSGICNIIERAREVTEMSRVLDVIGGFHLLSPEAHRLEETVRFFKKLSLRKLHACHCTDFHSRVALARTAEMEEVGSGLVLQLD
jgi:7,8-dihydropterin-6-yl-methyl-4-(beta-D-ribofuranosyl)aminobenzene 5'-phosphate synthase